MKTSLWIVCATAALALGGCAQPVRLTEQPQWLMSTSMTADAAALGARKAGTVAQVEPAVRYIFEKTPGCRLEPKSLNAFAHLRVGQWILRKTSKCYQTHPGQTLTVDLDSGQVVRIEQFDRSPLYVGDRVWVDARGVGPIHPGSTPLACAPHE